MDPRDIARWKAENKKTSDTFAGEIKKPSMGSVLIESAVDKIALAKFLENRNKPRSVQYTADSCEGHAVYENKLGYAYGTYEDTRTGRSINGRFVYEQDGTAHIIRLDDDQFYLIEQSFREQSKEQDGM